MGSFHLILFLLLLPLYLLLLILHLLLFLLLLFFLHLSCLPCQCNVAGSISSIVCNPVTGECQCKDNVEGMNCDTCKSGFQLLQESNPFGCSAGKTSYSLGGYNCSFMWVAGSSIDNNPPPPFPACCFCSISSSSSSSFSSHFLILLLFLLFL